MTLYLVDPSLELSIELNVSEPVERALALQWERLKDQTKRDAFCRRIALQLSSLIPDSIDWDIKEPTPAQLSYAVVLAKELDVAVPPEAIRYRGHMHAFLETYTAALKAKRESKC